MVSGEKNVGGLVGYNEHGAISRSYSAGSAFARDINAGGLVGMNYVGSLTDCYSVGEAQGYDHVGGLVGENQYGSISRCYAAGRVGAVNEVVGGLVGYQGGSVTYVGCLWDSEVNGGISGVGNSATPADIVAETTTSMQLADTYSSLGWDFAETWQMPLSAGSPRLSWQGITIAVVPSLLEVRVNEGDEPIEQSVILYNVGLGMLNWRVQEDCEWLEIAPASGDSSGEKRLASVRLDPGAFTAGVYGTSIMVFSSEAENKAVEVVVRLHVTYAGGAGSADNPYQIATPAQLDGLTRRREDWGKHFVLTANLDMAGRTYTDALIGPDTFGSSGFYESPFTGVFDGVGFAISGVRIDASEGDCIGLFGRVTGLGAEIRGLNLVDISV